MYHTDLAHNGGGEVVSAVSRDGSGLVQLLVGGAGHWTWHHEAVPTYGASHYEYHDQGANHLKPNTQCEEEQFTYIEDGVLSYSKTQHLVISVIEMSGNESDREITQGK